MHLRRRSVAARAGNRENENRTAVCRHCPAASQGNRLPIREVECAQEVDRCRQPASNRELPEKRVLPERDVKNGLMVGHASFAVTVRHRDLVKVGRKGREVVSG